VNHRARPISIVVLLALGAHTAWCATPQSDAAVRGRAIEGRIVLHGSGVLLPVPQGVDNARAL